MPAIEQTNTKCRASIDTEFQNSVILSEIELAYCQDSLIAYKILIRDFQKIT